MIVSKIMNHKSVLTSELIRFLKPKTNQNFIDATVGMGGHALAILSKTAPQGRILGIDWDGLALRRLAHSQPELIKEKRLILYQDNFKNLKEIAEKTGFSKVSGIYFDLGLGSWQIEDAVYGLSYQKDVPLDMRMSGQCFFKVSAREIINQYSEKELTEIFRDYGEVRKPHQIARKIVQGREKKMIGSTLQLVKITGVKNPAVLAKIFQALRIAVNDELENLNKVLPDAVSILEKGGKLAVISYHSGEDRIVKNFLREQQKEGILKILTKKPVVPSEGEVKENPRARSAKMRMAEKI